MMMVASCIKYIILVRSVRATPMGITKGFLAPSSLLSLTIPSGKVRKQTPEGNVSVPVRATRTKSHVNEAVAVQAPGVGALGCPCNTEVWWLHLPKCGTSFGIFAAHTCKQYTRENRNSYHTPVKADASDEFLSKIVGMFRQPEQRLASQLGNLNKYTCDYLEGCDPDSATCQRSRCYMKKNAKTLYTTDEASAGLWGLGRHVDYIINAVHKGHTPANDDFLGVAMQGCQTNMLNGNTCFMNVPPNITQVEMAVKKVNKMLFVGLQEEWLLSMCLFNRIVTGKIFVQPFELMNSRPTNGREKSTSYHTTGWPTDKHDGKVYAAAKARFWSDVRKYKITEQACAHTYDGEPLEEAS